MHVEVYHYSDKSYTCLTVDCLINVTSSYGNLHSDHTYHSCDKNYTGINCGFLMKAVCSQGLLPAFITSVTSVLLC